MNVQGLQVLASMGFEDYRLLDSGNGRKLERFGKVIVDRPEPQAMWRPRLDVKDWQRADAIFAADDDEEAGKWRRNTHFADAWPLSLHEVTLTCQLSSFRHLGLFPEQLPHWNWMRDRLAGNWPAGSGRTARVLNLFAYTGAASLLAAAKGAEVTHVDASRKAIAWAKENQTASNLTAAPIRWILDDARKFVAREVRRGKSYDLILVDPPKFGRGPGGEIWDLFTHLPPLLDDCARLLSTERCAIVLTSYAIRCSALSIGQLLQQCIGERSGRLDCGELAIIEESGGRALPTSLYARWISNDLA